MAKSSKLQRSSGIEAANRYNVYFTHAGPSISVNADTLTVTESGALRFDIGGEVAFVFGPGSYSYARKN